MARHCVLTIARPNRSRPASIIPVGYGPLYQGRFKSFVVQQDNYLLTSGRYFERNALRAGLMRQAEDWRWSSLWIRQNGSAEQKAILQDWPIDLPKNWLATVNRPQTAAEESAMQM